ncbi:hypothetical protein FF1_022806 [Malus domestica]
MGREWQQAPAVTKVYSMVIFQQACVVRAHGETCYKCETLLLADVHDSGTNPASGDATITTGNYCSPPRAKPYKEEKRVVLEQPGITFAILSLKLQQNIPDN